MLTLLEKILFALVALALTTHACAEQELNLTPARLPAVVDESDSLEEDFAEPISVPTSSTAFEPATLSERFEPAPRYGLSQLGAWKWRGITGSYTYIPRLDDGGLGTNDFELGIPFMVDLPRDGALTITPGGAVRLWDGPTGFDLPSHVYDANFDFGLRFRLGERWKLILGVTPGLYWDGESFDGEAFRVLGRALAIYQWSESLQWTIGAVYLDRDDIPAVPAVGFTWTPNENWKVDANMPRPKLSYRLFVEDEGAVWWSYVGAGMGGGQWLVTPPLGESQELSLRQFSLTMGIERRPMPYVSMYFEAGWVFGREIEIESLNKSFDPSDSFMLRAGVGY